MAVFSIRVYQVGISRMLERTGVQCLHYPSCSEYARIAYGKYSFVKATVVSYGRYRDCNPLSGRPYMDPP
jgi:putative component of membrane protein insertase Oxa1/YidC/SpoIIIJ protein YidD